MTDEQPGREICAMCGHERALHSDEEGLFCAFNAEHFECPCKHFEYVDERGEDFPAGTRVHVIPALRVKREP